MEQELQQAQEAYKLITEFFVTYSFQILGALIILAIGIIVAKKVSQLVLNICTNKGLDITLSRFISSTAKIIIIVMVAIIALGKIGISVTPFVAAIGALSLGAGLAMQGLLSNYGAGLNIILARPFVVGDTIRVQNVIGQVKEVHLAYTLLSDEDDVEITIPNKHIVGEIISNSHSDTLAEESVGISYDNDPEEAISVIMKALNGVENMSSERKPQVGIEDFGDSGIVIGIRFWAPTDSYFETRYRANAAIFKALKAANITIPYPQREIRMLETSVKSA
ncbi:MAG: mechanosensitive ion channel protein MscS [Zetaproteobacteria bacterium CG_4_9_14_3_um_filter_49_83]|nr:MAG: mechanosensitive ion channel protein MscS [Zetaproteobacteria bacterium CG1_02_49_23]PIQ34515.1 MAG: mechanosensitive ion channel protein MscS [Zetaproteobacteria bacterium CG17_big_fil_post_rev_8_21_14_2_50_50_13]PIV30034.1 MAG: mechanosensitive ion channel protein MscS [Zetaproteobacteria bacterium CG02_land_8_20_14_3_00_50_9]PIY55338.1 MAG: mechanosensitive ion channel protein MscS [Zetaproteobacteria bacterium CG_4_10_14_0_8_um_filter_49_80]PJA34497.1 MAG: mechanosensitive ion chann